MKFNVYLTIGIMLIIFGVYIGMCDSQVCFIPIVAGIVVLLFAAKQTQSINQLNQKLGE